jgi:serine/threonine protein kinase/tetratricopeptide (TPR) repeat protein
MIGKTLAHYQVLREIGRGAMGQVYLARDTRLNRNVALKMLPPAVVADGLRRRRFERESLALAALNHANIVTIHAIEEAEGQPFLVMEWIAGRTLAELIPACGLAPDPFFTLATPLAAAVAQAHRAGIVHRDLKPGNVMVRDDGVLKVVDFGISLIEPETIAEGMPELPAGYGDRLTGEGIAVGTLPYMSPEQLQGRLADARSDVFALGVILYEMATGQPPFRGGGPAALAAAILRDLPPPPTSFNRALPPALDRVVERCLAKREDARYPTAGELHRDLQAVWWPPAGSREALLDPGHSGHPGHPPHSGLRRLSSHAQPAARRHPLHPSSSQGHTPSVAVLPLRNLSGDAGQEYFSDGITEMVIANLAKVGGLRVIARASVMRYKEPRPELPEVARELGVRYLLEGSVLRSGDELMIVVALVDPASGGAVWGDTYRGNLREVFAFQQQVAQEAARAIKGELSMTDFTPLGNEPHEVTPEVYEAYLKARYLLNKRTPDAVREALGLLDGALALDADFALGWAARAECYVYLAADLINVLPPREALPMAREAAQRALGLDPDLSEAHAILGIVHMQSWEWGKVEGEFLRALELNPNNVDAYQKYTFFLTAQGRHDEALSAIHKARKLDPLSLPLRFGVISNCLAAGQYGEAAEGAKALVALQPDLWLGHYFLGNALSLQARYAEAAPELGRAVELSRRMPSALADFARNAALAGRREEAHQVVAELEEASTRVFIPPTTLANPLVALGEVDRALDCLDRAVELQDHNLLLLGVLPHYRGLHGHPRFQGILRRVGLGQPAGSSPA